MNSLDKNCLENYQQYFQKCLESGKINDPQFNYLIGLFIDDDIDKFQEGMDDMNLSNGFNSFLLDCEKQEQENELRKAQLIDLLKTKKTELDQIQDKLDQLVKKLEISENAYNSIKARIERYQAHDNPRLISELKAHEKKYQADLSTYQKIKDQFDKHEKEIILFEKTLFEKKCEQKPS